MKKVEEELLYNYFEEYSESKVKEVFHGLKKVDVCRKDAYFTLSDIKKYLEQDSDFVFDEQNHKFCITNAGLYSQSRNGDYCCTIIAGYHAEETDDEYINRIQKRIDFFKATVEERFKEKNNVESQILKLEKKIKQINKSKKESK